MPCSVELDGTRATAYEKELARQLPFAHFAGQGLLRAGQTIEGKLVEMLVEEMQMENA